MAEQEPRRAGGPKCIDEAREFGIDELFFSTTDPKGIIQASNQVFVRVSGYSWPELRRQPHSMIRHPDVPRVVFQILWDTIGAGRPVAAYIKNRAKDGRHYWVVALVMPIPGGYLSVRCKPSSSLFATAQKLYAELRGIEADVEAAGQGKKAAIAASAQALETRLKALGFANYEAFMRRLLQVELQSRDQALQARARASHTGSGAGEHSDGFVAGLLESCQASLSTLRVLFADLDTYVRLTATIRDKAKSMAGSSDAIRLLSLNAGLEASRLGQSGSALGQVLDWLSAASGETTRAGSSLSENLINLAHSMETVVFDLGAAKLQIEMIHAFAHELLSQARTEEEQDVVRRDHDAIGVLQAAFEKTARRALGSLDESWRQLKTFRAAEERASRSARTLHLTYIAGKMEIARIPERQHLEQMFAELEERLKASAAEMEQLESLVAELGRQLATTHEHGAALEQSIGQMNAASVRAVA